MFLKDLQAVLLLSYQESMILEEEFVGLYDEYSSKNPQFCEACGRSSRMSLHTVSVSLCKNSSGWMKFGVPRKFCAWNECPHAVYPTRAYYFCYCYNRWKILNCVWLLWLQRFVLERNPILMFVVYRRYGAQKPGAPTATALCCLSINVPRLIFYHQRSTDFEEEIEDPWTD